MKVPKVPKDRYKATAKSSVTMFAYCPKKNLYNHERRSRGSPATGAALPVSATSGAASGLSRGAGVVASNSGMRCVRDMIIVSLRSSSRRRNSIWSSRLRVYLSCPASWTVLDAFSKVSR
jgi:hypothetical protein